MARKKVVFALLIVAAAAIVAALFTVIDAQGAESPNYTFGSNFAVDWAGWWAVLICLSALGAIATAISHLFRRRKIAASGS